MLFGGALLTGVGGVFGAFLVIIGVVFAAGAVRGAGAADGRAGGADRRRAAADRARRDPRALTPRARLGRRAARGRAGPARLDRAVRDRRRAVPGRDELHRRRRRAARPRRRGVRGADHVRARGAAAADAVGEVRKRLHAAWPARRREQPAGQRAAPRGRRAGTRGAGAAARGRPAGGPLARGERRARRRGARRTRRRPARRRPAAPQRRRWAQRRARRRRALREPRREQRAAGRGAAACASGSRSARAILARAPAEAITAMHAGARAGHGTSQDQQRPQTSASSTGGAERRSPRTPSDGRERRAVDPQRRGRRRPSRRAPERRGSGPDQRAGVPPAPVRQLHTSSVAREASPTAEAGRRAQAGPTPPTGDAPCREADRRDRTEAVPRRGLGPGAEAAARATNGGREALSAAKKPRSAGSPGRSRWPEPTRGQTQAAAPRAAMIHRTFRSLDDPPKLVGFTIRQWVTLIAASARAARDRAARAPAGQAGDHAAARSRSGCPPRSPTSQRAAGCTSAGCSRDMLPLAADAEGAGGL